MTVKQIPDYDLEEMIVVTAPGQLRALADPLRGTLLDLLLERAATVTEMAQAVDRPKSTVAYHVNLLVDAGLLQVVRTRRSRSGTTGGSPAPSTSARSTATRTSRSCPRSTGSRRRRPRPSRRTRSTTCAARWCTRGSRGRKCGTSGRRCSSSPASSRRSRGPAIRSTASRPASTRPTRPPCPTGRTGRPTYARLTSAAVRSSACWVCRMARSLAVRPSRPVAADGAVGA
jgi:hypothetical protein